MKRQRKKYATPTRKFDKQRIERERELLKSFGLKKKTELWKVEALIRNYRSLARELAAGRNAEREKIIVNKLIKMGVLNEGATLDDVLGLTIEKLLERRLPMLIFRKGLANNVKQARQLVTHGHVTIDGRRVSYPSYIVTKDEEGKIQVNFIRQQKKSEATAPVSGQNG